MKNVMKAMSALLMVVLFVSCGSKPPTPEEVYNKIQNKENLSQVDYTVMIEYVGEYAQKAQADFNKINAAPSTDSSEYIKAFGNLSDLYQKYPYLDSFRSALYKVPDGMLDEQNQEIALKYANDESFPLPAGLGVEIENPDVQGMVQDMPSTDTTQVISTGVGEAVSE